MNLLLISLSLVSLLGEYAGAAPAVTSVHVSFVSGNKKTQYSHGTHTRPAVVQYNLEAAGSGDEGVHFLRRRSISRRPPPEQSSSEGVAIPGDVPRTKRRLREGQPQSKIRLVLPSSTPTKPTGTNPNHTNQFVTSTTSNSINPTKRGRTPWASSKTNVRKGHHSQPLTFRTTTTSGTPTKRHKPFRTSTIPTSPTRTSAPIHATSGSLPPMRRLRSRVRFVASGETASTGHDMTASTSTSSSSTSSPSTTDTDMTESKKRKDSKAVKRSPYIENFEARGITFPDFDEFGGNEFGALKNFIGSGGGGGGGAIASHTHANPESLSPDGVFLPPLPTEASDYSDDGGHDGHSHSHSHHDPYLVDKETAKYAAQHPPFFAAFPHKRTVLDLNERRVEQGLEPNILRSIRPFFAFFDAANLHHHRHYPSHPHPSPHHPRHLDHGHIHNHLHHHHPESVVVAEVHGGLPPPHHLLPVIGHGHSSTPSSNHLGESYHAVIVSDNNHHGHPSSSSPLLDDDDPNLLFLAQSLLESSGPSGGSGHHDAVQSWNIFPHKKRKK